MHPVIEAFLSSDLFGKIIFIALFLLSMMSWALFLQKISICRYITKEGTRLLGLSSISGSSFHQHHPFASLYAAYQRSEQEGLSLDRLLSCAQAQERKHLEKGLYLLPTIVSLAPFLGLLGTVWGILLTFHELQHGASAQTNTAVMSGLAMALGATVVGLFVAIPALVSYNYLRAQIRHFCIDMESFSGLLLAKAEKP
ncbi:MAG: MotA/TolQ/ExbB proton channel family protein [Verrucomicrobia bacterium]|nr:MotA/TolQ/ExbB proton channel family protein [Verrucomicrobiota bacterium]MBS0645400.1 MotA/TolQ/ExbB proton channel family protein [Verrucomicrobiota bacterium]